MSKTLLPCLLLLAAASPALADEAKPADGTDSTDSTDSTDNTVAIAAAEPIAGPGGYYQNTSPAAAPPSLIDDATVNQIYGKKGTYEAGGSMGLMVSSEFRALSFSGQLGWFVANDFELSAVVSIANVKAAGESATTYALLAEPSYHVPLNRMISGFVGVGVGIAYADTLGAGLDIAPRLGANFVVGEAGILTPSIQYSYMTRSEMTEDDIATTALTSAMMVNVGYTRIW